MASSSSSAKFSRHTLTTSQKKSLLRRYEDGSMQACNKATLTARQAAAVETGLPISSVNVSYNCTSGLAMYMQAYIIASKADLVKILNNITRADRSITCTRVSTC